MSRGDSDLKTAFPATRTSAPKDLSFEIFFMLTPPSISIFALLLVSLMSYFNSLILSKVLVIKVCPPKPGFTLMRQIKSTF